MKRIFLFLATNLAVVGVLSVSLRLLGVDRYLAANGLDVGALMIFSLAVGFAGSIISLLISKPVARWSTGADVIEAPRDADEAWLLSTVQRLAQRAFGITDMPAWFDLFASHPPIEARIAALRESHYAAVPAR